MQNYLLFLSLKHTDLILVHVPLSGDSGKVTEKTIKVIKTACQFLCIGNNRFVVHRYLLDSFTMTCEPKKMKSQICLKKIQSMTNVQPQHLYPRGVFVY